jgi:DNA-binding CsgD family transcriptional regulator
VDTARDRAIDRVARLAAGPLDLVAFWRDCTEVLAPTIPFHARPCWYTLDPASLLITSHYQDGLDEFPAEWLVAEYARDDVHKLVDVARSADGISTLHEATGGQPSRSRRWHENMRYGGDQELIARLRARTGEVWGALGLYRSPGQPMFDAADKAYLAALTPHLAAGARRALLAGAATDPEGPDAPGLLILTETLEVDSTTPGVARWLSDLPDGDPEAGRLPSSVRAVAAQALRTADEPDRPGEVAVSRVLSRSGTWVVLHGAPLVASGSRRVAVIVEPAHPARIQSLLMSAYGLTARERDVTRLILQGYSTAQAAETLSLSAHTVQQHLKSIFDKTGVRSRRDLVGRVFFAHYEPRVRDNEHRTVAGRPVRGGPVHDREK